MKKILFIAIILAVFMIGAASTPLANASECEFKICDIYCCQELILEHQSIIAYQAGRLEDDSLKDENDVKLEEDLRESIKSLKQRIASLQELIALKIKMLERPVCR